MSQTLIYTGSTHITGGRDGGARSSDGALDIRLSPPGSHGPGSNPEQLLGAGWSACFLSAIGIAAKEKQVAFPATEAAIDADIDLVQSDDGYTLRARLNVSLPGIERETALALIERAHQTCPYSKVLRAGVPVETNLV
jgi:Ohr subfamily peroxiredoxin